MGNNYKGIIMNIKRVASLASISFALITLMTLAGKKNEHLVLVF